MNARIWALAALLVLSSGGLVLYKTTVLDYELFPRAAADRWIVQMLLTGRGHGEPAKARFFLPVSSPYQRIYDERVLSEGIEFFIRPKGPNRVGYVSDVVDGILNLSYRFAVHLRPRPAELPSPEAIEESRRRDRVDPRYLAPTPEIQSNDPRVAMRLEEVTPPHAPPLLLVRSIFDYLADEVVPQEVSGRSDALAVLQRERGGPLGIARLFVALARSAGIPARVVGGIDLVEGSRSQITYWAETFLGGRWLPMDPLSRHFGTLPATRLVLFEGDHEPLETRGLEKVDFRISMLRAEISQERLYQRRVRRSDAWLDRVSLFVLPVRTQMVLRILLLIPFGALVVAVFRNLVGIPTFGTFMPVLVALAFIETTLLVGLAFLVGIILVGWLFRILVDRLQLLMVPRLSLLLTIVILLIAGITLVAEKLGFGSAMSVALFPIVIITATIERFFVMMTEEGTRNTLRSLAGTIVVATACYLVIGNELLQRMLLTFPEMLLWAMAVQLLLGRYTGYRLSEWLRFEPFRTGMPET
ncbi:MAG: hypothetical protein D6729_09100 [Deltaproteobacteria bacterium]|nr:MAG: hypothetical protein D6729_09100 [Deltaproteobacteria bacterium]